MFEHEHDYDNDYLIQCNVLNVSCCFTTATHPLGWGIPSIPIFYFCINRFHVNFTKYLIYIRMHEKQSKCEVVKNPC